MSESGEDRMPLSKNYLVGLMLGFVCLGIAVGIGGIATDKPASATFGGALVTAAAIWFAIYQYLGKNDDERSKFFLEEAIKGIAEASKLLQENEYDRVTWVLAARILSRVRKISRQITNAAHQSVFEIYQDQYRTKFSKALLVGDADLGGFFYGLPSVTPSLDGANQVVRNYEEPRWMPEEVLRQIYFFADDAQYVNTLTETFEDAQMLRLEMFFPSLHAYLIHLRANPPMTKVRVRSSTQS